MLCLTALPAFHPAGVTAADSLCPVRPYTPSAPKPDADRFIPAFHAFLSLKDGSLSLKPAGWSQWRSHYSSPVADSWRLCSVGAEFHDCLPAAPEHHSPITPYCIASANVPLPCSTANHVPIYPVPTLCCTACLYAPLFSLPQYCTASTVSFCTTSMPRARSHHSVDSTLLAIGTLLAHYLHIACTLPAVGTPLAHCLHIYCTLLTHFLLLTHRLHTTHTWYKVRHI